MAQEPDSKTLNIKPGMGLKFMRNGLDSVSLVAMFSVDGQPTWNFFANDFSNHIPGITDPTLIPLGIKFKTATDWIQTVGLSDFSTYTADGAAVSAPVFPWKLRFHPTGEFEFPDAYPGVDFTEQLMTIPSGSVLYEVYGMDKPTELGGQEFHIGSLKTTSVMTTTKWGDKNLFFRHQDMSDDLAIHPEWTAYTPLFTALTAKEAVNGVVGKVASKCPFAYLFQ